MTVKSLPKAVVLVSGGMDSAVTIALAREQGYQVHALSVAYGQRHSSELAASVHVSTMLGAVEHKTVTVDLRSIGGSALTADIDVPLDAAESSDIPVTYVPARNTIMLSIALGWAEVLGSSDIWCGVNAVDYSGYPDCRDDTIKAMQLALNLGMERRFVLETPLMWLDKQATWALAAELAITDLVIEHTHTCYRGDRTHRHPWGYGCADCPACRLRADGFAAWEARH